MRISSIPLRLARAWKSFKRGPDNLYNPENPNSFLNRPTPKTWTYCPALPGDEVYALRAPSRSGTRRSQSLIRAEIERLVIRDGEILYCLRGWNCMFPASMTVKIDADEYRYEGDARGYVSDLLVEKAGYRRLTLEDINEAVKRVVTGDMIHGDAITNEEL